MKSQTLRKILLLSLLISSFSLASTSNSSLSVTASDYANFLNHIATSDPNFLYDEKMGSDSQAACIVRFGMPGNFHYEIIVGRENDPITFVNENDANAYSHWLANGVIVSCIPDNVEDNTLHSFDSLAPARLALQACLGQVYLATSQVADIHFTLHSTSIENGSCTLSLVSSSTSYLPSSKSGNSCLKDAGIVAGVIGIVACHELMLRPGDIELETFQQRGNEAEGASMRPFFSTEHTGPYHQISNEDAAADIESSIMAFADEEKKAEIDSLKQKIQEARFNLESTQKELGIRRYIFSSAKKSVKQASEALERAEGDFQTALAMEAVWQKVIRWKKLNQYEQQEIVQKELSESVVKADSFRQKAHEMKLLSERKYQSWREDKPLKAAVVASEKGVHYFLESINSLREGKGDLAILQQEVAEEFCRAADFWKSSAQANAFGQYYKNNLNGSAYRIEQSAVALEKEINAFIKSQEAEVAGDREIANEWYQSALKFRKVSEVWRRAAQPLILEHQQYGSDQYGWRYFEEENYQKAAISLEQAANLTVERIDALFHMQEARLSGSVEKEIAWSNVAQKFQRAVDSWNCSYKHYASCYKKEGDLWGKGTYGGIAFSQQQAAEALSKSITLSDKAAESEQSANRDEALVLYQLVGLCKQLADQRSNASELYLSGNQKEGDLAGGNKLNRGAAYITECAIEALERKMHSLNKAKEERIAGKNEYAELWETIANRLQAAVDAWNNFSFQSNRFDIGLSHQDIADTLEKRITSLIKAEKLLSESNHEQQAVWADLQKTYETEVSQRDVACQAYEQSDRDAGIRWGRGRTYSDVEEYGAASLSQDAIVAFENCIDALGEARKESSATSEEIAAAWRELADYSKLEADYWNEMSQECGHHIEKREPFYRINRGGVVDMTTIFESTNDALKSRIHALKEAQQVNPEEDWESLLSWKGIANLRGIEIERLNKAKAFLGEKKQKEARQIVNSCYVIQRIVHQLQKSINASIQAHEFHRKWKHDIGDKWYRISQSRKLSADHFYQSFQADDAGNEKEKKKSANVGWKHSNHAHQLEEKLRLHLATIDYLSDKK